MHKIMKSRSLFSCDASEAYCFPDILKESGMTDETDSKDTRSSFQRICCDVFPDLPGESPNGKFRKSGFSSEADERKILREMVFELQKNETKSYQKGVQDGLKEGLLQGRKTGMAEGLKEIETILLSLQQAMQEIKILRKELCRNAEKETIRLSLAIARSIMLQESATNPKVIAGIVKKTFETIAINPPVRIRINPSELAYMQERRHLIPIEGDVVFIEDALVSCGGCVVESLAGDVDARIESQIEMLEEIFLTELEKYHPKLEALS